MQTRGLVKRRSSHTSGRGSGSSVDIGDKKMPETQDNESSVAAVAAPTPKKKRKGQTTTKESPSTTTTTTASVKERKGTPLAAPAQEGRANQTPPKKKRKITPTAAPSESSPRKNDGEAGGAGIRSSVGGAPSYQKVGPFFLPGPMTLCQSDAESRKNPRPTPKEKAAALKEFAAAAISDPGDDSSNNPPSSKSRPIKNNVDEIICVGLNQSAVNNYAQIDPEFCLTKWDHCRGKWCSKKCRAFAVRGNLDDPDLTKWTRAVDIDSIGKNEKECVYTYQCPSCKHAGENAVRPGRYPEIRAARGKSISEIKPIVPVSDRMKNDVRRLYRSYKSCDKDMDDFRTLPMVKEAMLLLYNRGDASILCDDGRVIIKCGGSMTAAGENSCEGIVIKVNRSNVVTRCNPCMCREAKEKTREKYRAEHFEEQISITSKVAFQLLNDEQKVCRMKEMKKEMKRQARLIKKLQTQVEAEERKEKEEADRLAALTKDADEDLERQDALEKARQQEEEKILQGGIPAAYFRSNFQWDTPLDGAFG